MAEFPTLEYESRRRRLAKLLEENDLDLLFVSGEENNRYFSGARSLVTWKSFTRPVFSVMDGKDPPVVLTHQSLKDATRSEGYYSEVRSYVDITKSPIKRLKALLREMLPKGGRVGFEGEHEQRIGLPFSDMTALISSVSQEIEFADASRLIWQLRMTKSDVEVGCMERAGKVLGEARPEAIARMKAGMTERDAARVVGAAILEHGADEVAFVHVNAGPPHTWYPTDRRLRPGDTVYVDAGATVKGYTCEYDRIATVGSPTQAQKDLHESVRGIANSMQKLMKTGVLCSEVAAECNRVSSKLHVPTAKWGRAGHGQGLLATEPPSVALHDQTALVPGMTVSNEPGMITREGVFIWEDVYEITPQGPDTLSVETRELLQIG
jgi:Xaa-Pro aminopeptidase